MNSIVQEASANLGRAIAECGAKLHIEKLPWVHASPTDMLQVMQNLIGNALKFRRANTVPEVWVMGREEGTHWCFEVIDNGIGIEAAYSEKIFVPFKRLNDRSKYAGSGIGLAIAEKIVQRYAGRIWCTSVPGKGSNFKFTIERQGP
jgi:light-regulated signal transduction histidine kinase (bacteriophytochrome)